MKRTAAKKKLRKLLQLSRKRLSASFKIKKSQRILTKIKNLPPIKHAKSIAVYLSLKSEVETRGFIQWAWAKNKNILIPMTEKGPRGLCFVLYTPEDMLKKTKFGTLELKNRKTPFSYKKIGAILVPGVGFDKDGNRLGFGGGYYDRLLKKEGKAKKIGLAFETQIIKKLPHQKHDVKMDQICTEAGVIHIDKSI